MRQRYLLIATLFLTLSLMLTTYAQEDRLQIVASHSILADVVANVAGEAADVTSTMPRGADPHSFQPTPNDLTALADADVIFVNGAFFEEGLLEAIENAATDINVVTASSCVEILPFTEHSHEDEAHVHEEDEANEEAANSELASLCELHYEEMAALHEVDHDHEEDMAEEDHDHADETVEEAHDHDHEATEEEHDHGAVETLGPLYTLACEGHDHEAGLEDEGEHDHGNCDPHVWMDPHNVMYWTMLIRDELIKLDPTNIDTYIANAEAYLEELDALAHDFVGPMIASVPEENRILVTNHDSLGYFAARAGFELVGTVIPGGSTLSEPSAAAVASLIDVIREENVPAIFAETTVNTSLVDQIAQETGASVYVLYSGSLSEEGGSASSYVDYIHYNITTIVEALGGGLE